MWLSIQAGEQLTGAGDGLVRDNVVERDGPVLLDPAWESEPGQPRPDLDGEEREDAPWEVLVQPGQSISSRRG